MQVGAVFGIIFALIVMAFVLYFGSAQIMNIICLGNVGQTNKVIRDLENMVDDIQASGEGSSDTFRMGTPSSARLCFVDPDDPSRSITGGWLPDPDLFIEEEIRTNGYNAWIEYNCGSSVNGYRMDYIVLKGPSDPDRNYNFCADSGDTLLLTNIGIEVRLEKLTV